MDELYRAYIAPYWVFADALWCAIGLWCAIRPPMLVGPYAPLLLTREIARHYGLSPSSTERILSIADQREKLRYDDRIGRIGGFAVIAAGLLGIFASLDPAIVASLATVILAWTTTFYLISSRRADGTDAVSHGTPHSGSVVPVWLIGSMVIAAVTVMMVATSASLFAGVSMLVVASAIWRCATLPGVFFGEDVAFERLIDARFRLSRVAVIIIFSSLPLQVWALTSYADPVPSTIVQIARLIAQAMMVAQIAFLFAASWKYNRDLRRVSVSA